MDTSSSLTVSCAFMILVALLATAVGGTLFWNQPMGANVEPTADAQTIMVWPETAKDKQIEVGDEYDTTTMASDLVAGKRVMRITNVGKAELHFWPAPEETNTGTSVVICPGGGFYILAWDLEGTEIAKWLNSIGVNAFVLKYRVPTAKHANPVAGPAEDLQRSIALVRHNAKKWNVNPKRIGALGFSAGGCALAAVAMQTETYEAIDEVDAHSRRPDFIVPVYGAWMVDLETSGLREGMELNKDSPPAFIVHAFDDFVPVQNALLLAKLYKDADVPVECHVYDSGGHGFGARLVEDVPITNWPKLCEAWMKRNGLLGE